MIEGISGIGNNVNYTLEDSVPETTQNDNMSFAEILEENLSQVNDLGQKADHLSEQFALGEINNIHEVTVAAEKAQTAINLTSAVQNQIIEAYEEIMRLQV